ncbi:MAG: V-type ATP synthase subunit E family protein [Chloroflexi bacterium]|jgi:V/A-type H+-transporting ATPase subunit E|nr:V-type ATP synthase subunit E family protein [Chloroflexota bacterium]
MKPEEENIENLSRAILFEAKSDAEQIQTDAKEKADAIRQQAQQRAESERKEIMERAKQDAERIRSQVVATAQMKARTLQLEHREKLLDKVFNAAKEKLASLQKRPDYDKVVAELLREAVTQLKVDQAEVRVDAATQKVLKEQTLSELSKELKTQLSIGKALEDGLGIVINADHGRLHYDNTLETRLNRLQSALRSAVYHVLMGEKL